MSGGAEWSELVLLLPGLHPWTELFHRTAEENGEILVDQNNREERRDGCEARKVQENVRKRRESRKGRITK
jgi:hypothetical protein